MNFSEISQLLPPNVNYRVVQANLSGMDVSFDNGRLYIEDELSYQINTQVPPKSPLFCFLRTPWGYYPQCKEFMPQAQILLLEHACNALKLQLCDEARKVLVDSIQKGTYVMYLSLENSVCIGISERAPKKLRLKDLFIHYESTDIKSFSNFKTLKLQGWNSPYIQRRLYMTNAEIFLCDSILHSFDEYIRKNRRKDENEKAKIRKIIKKQLCTISPYAPDRANLRLNIGDKLWKYSMVDNNWNGHCRNRLSLPFSAYY